MALGYFLKKLKYGPNNIKIPIRYICKLILFSNMLLQHLFKKNDMCKKHTLISVKLLNIFLSIVLLIVSTGPKVFGQDIKIELGNTEVALNETFTISIIVEGDRIRNYDEFPDIPGFTKQAKSTSSSTNIINGKVSSSHKIIQNYKPNMEGTYTIPPFEMTINDKNHSSPGARIQVTPAKQGGPILIHLPLTHSKNSLVGAKNLRNISMSKPMCFLPLPQTNRKCMRGRVSLPH
jgi:hypothetical protein